MKRVFVALTLLVSTAAFAPAGAQSPAARDAVKASPAYGALVGRRVTVEVALAELLESYTPGHPAVARRRAELQIIEREMAKLGAVRPRRLTEAYGDLLLRKINTEVELRELLATLTPSHPDVKRKRVELAAVERGLAALSR